MTDQFDPSAKRDAEAEKCAVDRAINTSIEILGINKRFDAGNKRMDRIEDNQKINLDALKKNTLATETIAKNTAPLISLAADLAAGTNFLCRIALGVRFVLKEVVEPFWKPAAICWVVYMLFTQHKLPEWLPSFFKVLG